MSLKSKLMHALKKRETLTIDIDGTSRDVGLPAEVLADLGGTVWFAAVSNMARDKGQSAAADHATKVMLEFTSSLLARMTAIGTEKPEHMALSWEAVKWIAPALGIELKGDELKGIHPVHRPRLRKRAQGRTAGRR